ncbi:hypothetical protein L0222_09575 [bacterium]|nr:hypothetical protein [bacterium]MCI0603864.1 hypothetical protein [bacterium]
MELTRKTFWSPCLAIAVPFIIYVFHALLFRNWIVDDAAISFVYARNLAYGHGLVSQPAVPPVEGYSNFAWVLLLTPFFQAHVFHPILTPKIVSAILVFVCFFIVHKTVKLITKHPNLGTGFILALLSINTSFVVWTTSGLENALFAFLTALLLWKTIQFSLNPDYSRRVPVIIAVIALLCALTRPDGVLFFALFPAFLLADVLVYKRPLATAMRSGLIYAGIYTILFAIFILFRFFYFGEIFPNTFFAKSTTYHKNLISLLLIGPAAYTKLYKLFSSIFAGAGLFMISIIGISVYMAVLKLFTRQHFILLLMLLVVSCSYMLLPVDWMPEYRLATAFFAPFYIYLFALGETVKEVPRWKNPAKTLFAICIALVFVGASAVRFANHTLQFKKRPTYPLLSNVKNHRPFEKYAAALGLKEASLLTPDVGAPMYYLNLRIYDLAGLTDKTIARTLGKQQTVFYDYVFERTKPTFIRAHSWWAYKADFYSDPRFLRDYIAIEEHMTQVNRVNVPSGEYVRKDAGHSLEFLVRSAKNHRAKKLPG